MTGLSNQPMRAFLLTSPPGQTLTGLSNQPMKAFLLTSPSPVNVSRAAFDGGADLDQSARSVYG